MDLLENKFIDLQAQADKHDWFKQLLDWLEKLKNTPKAPKKKSHWSIRLLKWICWIFLGTFVLLIIALLFAWRAVVSFANGIFSIFGL